MAIGTAALSLYLYHYAVRFAEYYVPFAVFAAGLAARDLGVSAVDRVPLMPPDYLARAGARLNEIGRPGEMVFSSLC